MKQNKEEEHISQIQFAEIFNNSKVKVNTIHLMLLGEVCLDLEDAIKEFNSILEIIEPELSKNYKKLKAKHKIKPLTKKQGVN